MEDLEKFANELLSVIKTITQTNEITVTVDSNPIEGTAFIYNFENIDLINQSIKKKIASKENQFLLEFIIRQGVKEIILDHRDLADYEKIDLGWVSYCINNKMDY